MSSTHTVLKYIRLIHLYIGIFIAPALLFFAFTGALQTFSLHETTRGSNYKPPAWAVTLAQIHKTQTPVVPVKKQAPSDQSSDKAHQDKAPKSAQDKSQSSPAAVSQPDEHSPAQKPSDAAAPKPHNALPLKCFFLLAAIGLFTSTLSGLYMSYKYVRNRSLITGLLIAGIVVPVLLTIF
jgi:hypothetical protein